ncbi:MAG: hypothetical protein WDM92_08165 [Caulobacteraceae bacterium]
MKGVGASWVRQVDRTYDLKAMTGALREALTTPEAGPKIVIAQSECMLTASGASGPSSTRRVKAGQRRVRERFGVDPDTCTGDHSCIRLSGCPSLSIKPNPDPLRPDPIAHVDNSCVGCGLCGEVSHAAVLCPSFLPGRDRVQPQPLGAGLRQGPRRGDRLAEARADAGRLARAV